MFKKGQDFTYTQIITLILSFSFYPSLIMKAIVKINSGNIPF